MHVVDPKMPEVDENKIESKNCRNVFLLGPRAKISVAFLTASTLIPYQPLIDRFRYSY